MSEKIIKCINGHVNHIFVAICPTCEKLKDPKINPALKNYLEYSAACSQAAIDCIKLQKYSDAIKYVEIGHVYTASGEHLDHLAVQVGVPHRRGVPVPDADVRDAIYDELRDK